MSIVHHHLLYYAEVDRENLNEEDFKELFDGLLGELDMKCLMEPRFAFSHQKAWTGLRGIITSHLTFHYWTVEQYVQFDIYSCKPFDRKKAVDYLNQFWQATNTEALFIDRDRGFHIQELNNQSPRV